MYGKVFASMYRGTLYGHWEAIVTMQQLVVLADADGIVDMTPQAIAATTSIPLDIITKGISKLESADPYSRTPGEEGRRIVCIDEHKPWGWQIVNYLKYKYLKDADEVRAQTRERVRKHRETRNESNAEKRDVTLGNAPKRHTDTDTDTDTRKRVERSRGSRLPTGWVPSEVLTAWAAKERPDLDVLAVAAKFRDYWSAVPGSKGVKLDWDATFRNFVRGEHKGAKHAIPDYSSVIANLKD